MSEFVVLVNKSDRKVGIEEKIEAHRKGKLHRAFSVFIFNLQGENLLQKRAASKYHSGGMWTNACDGHPRPLEEIDAAAHRRLVEELGFDCELKKIFTFVYKADLGNNLIEHEFDHVYFGLYDGEVKACPDEVEDFKWVGMTVLKRDMSLHPEKYSPWFKVAFKRLAPFISRYVKIGKDKG